MASVLVQLLAMFVILALSVYTNAPRWLCACVIVPIIATISALLPIITAYIINSVGGHRGCSADAPENTIDALRLAYEHGAQAVEFDVEFTKDNVAILLHDSTVDRTTNGSGAIADLTWQQVQKLNAHAQFDHSNDRYQDVKIPTLDAAVKYCVDNKIKIFFDVKEPDSRAVEALIKLYDLYPWLYENAAVCSFYPSLVYRIKQRNHRIITGHTWRRWAFSTRDTESTIPRYTGVKQLWATIVDMINVWSLHSWMPSITAADLVLTNRFEISPAYVKHLYDQSRLHVVAWTVNDEREQMYYRDTLKIPYLTDQTSTTNRLNKAADILDNKN